MKNTRGSSYPAMSLPDAVEKLRQVAKVLARGEGSKDEIIQAMGYKGDSGPSARALASLGYYNLLDRVGSGKYTVSVTGLKILYPEDGDNSVAISTAAMSPDLYSKLYERYMGSELPPQLANTLILSYGINAKNAESAARNFRLTMSYASLLDDNGILSTIEDKAENQPVVTSMVASMPSIPNITQNTPNTSSDDLTVLPSKIKISFPEELRFAVLTGEFGDEIKKLETKAQQILMQHNNKGTGPSDEETGITKA